MDTLSCWNQHRFKTKWDDTLTNTTANIATAVVATDVPFEHPYFNWPSERKALPPLLSTAMEAGQEVLAPLPSPKFGSLLLPPCWPMTFPY